MKRFSILLLLAVLSGSVSAQLQIGVKGGLNLKDLRQYVNGEPIPTDESQFAPGLHAGGFLTIKAGDRIGIQAELLYSNKGAQFSTQATTTNINLAYVTVPVMLRLKLLGPIGVEAGPEFGYRFLAKQVTDGTITDIKSTYVNDTDFGFNAGLVFRPLKKLRGGLRYYWGLSSVVGQSVIAGQTFTSQNRVTMVYLEYALFGK